MTKLRSPLTFQLALTKIAALIEWWKVAEICGQAERTVRNWSDEDTSGRINMDAALKLDVAYQAAGGDGAPMFQVYSTRLKADTAAALFSCEQLQHSVAVAAKENGEAIAAAINAARPNASPADIAIAERELEEAIAASTNTLARIRAGRSGDVAPGGKQ